LGLRVSELGIKGSEEKLIKLTKDKHESSMGGSDTTCKHERRI